MIIRGKKDVAKYISKYIILEFLTLAIVTNLHQILEVVFTKFSIPEMISNNIFTFVDMSSGLIGFAVSCGLAVSGINVIKCYYKNRGEHEINTSNTEDYDNILRRGLERASEIEEHNLDKSNKIKRNTRTTTKEIEITGIEEIKTQEDIDYHKKLINIE